MFKSHEKFHAANGKRQILIVDDELINRELLGHILEEDYEPLYACDGLETLELMRRHGQTLSMVLLDLMMPGMNGIEVLRVKKKDPAIAQIPIIVVTADHAAEAECLTLGAIDFISKPYPQPDVIRARVLRTIELVEDRQIILSTERDVLTGLYSREYFYRYAEQLDQYHPETPMDAIVIDINHFRMINERFGTACGDAVLRCVGERVRDMVRDEGGIVCRRESDTFLVYCPHGRDYRAILNDASEGLAGDDRPGSRIRLRMGVYENADKTLDIERRFDRAQIAADSVRLSFSHAIGFYDERLHKKELFDEQLIEDFHAAVEERQFEVWYQPKFNIRRKTPFLTSAEALVRWRHPKLGMVSPGVFIPLFEANGLIETLDRFVWRETAARLRDWKDRLGFCVPVSVNVSRVDMLDPGLVETFAELLREYGLTAQDLLLEITESAYTQDSDQIIQTVTALRMLGFQVEMDDFGTGYSSLNMLSTLPIDALKLDMQFIRNAFAQRRDTRMLELIIELAGSLAVPVIAEGVETAEQLHALRAMGCDIVQGYYFSKPVPAGEFERFLIERRDRPAGLEAALPGGIVPDFAGLAKALSRDIESIYYVDIETDCFLEFISDGAYGLLPIETSGSSFFTECEQNIQKAVWREDWERVANALDKPTLLGALRESKSFSMDYRLMVDSVGRWYRMKVIPAEEGESFRHIIVGVSNVDPQITREQRALAEQQNLSTFPRISQALAQDYFIIYYVDVETDYFIEYRAGDDFNKIGIEKQGEDFFNLSRRNIPRFTSAEDVPGFLEVFTKENVLHEVDNNGSFSITYRMLMEGGPKYVMMKAARLDDRHIVIGTSNINAEVQRRKAAMVRSSVAQALSSDYFLIFYIDTKTDRYIEYRPTESDTELDLEQGRENFFDTSRESIFTNVCEESREQVRKLFDKEHLLELLRENGSYTMDYRYLMNGVPTYIHMKASRMADRDDTHIVLGLRNIDEHVRREQAQARALQKATELASRDGLTGVKSKRVFVEAEMQWDAGIEENKAAPFAVAVFDLNDLKTINDTMGHAAGDSYICDGCALVCKTFQHSPVYRIGGDEFAAILTGQDFERRRELKESFRALNAARRPPEEAVVACGMADYVPGRDTRFQDVFERADADMYENKKELKNNNIIGGIKP